MSSKTVETLCTSTPISSLKSSALRNGGGKIATGKGGGSANGRNAAPPPVGMAMIGDNGVMGDNGEPACAWYRGDALDAAG